MENKKNNDSIVVDDEITAIRQKYANILQGHQPVGPDTFDSSGSKKHTPSRSKQLLSTFNQSKVEQSIDNLLTTLKSSKKLQPSMAMTF